jgi:hypothetical protein
VPGTATGLADIGTGDLDPPEVSRRRQHLRQQLPVVGLDRGAPSQRQASLGDPLRQLVA